MDFFSRATSFLFLFFLHGFVARMNRRTLVRVFFYFNSKSHLETVPSESHACYI